MKCFDKNNQVYQELSAVAESSGIPTFKLDIFIRNYYDKYERFPHLDEIPGIDSYNYLREKLGIKTIGDTDYVTQDRLKEVTGKNTIEELMAFLNNKYSDKEISIGRGEFENIIHIDRRASIYDEVPTLNFDWKSVLRTDRVVDFETEVLEKTSSVGILNNIIQRLLKRHGVNIQEYTNDALPKNAPSNANQVNAFILNGTIYINTDNSRADAPLHELLHLIIGELRNRDSMQYETLLRSVEDLPNFQDKFMEYQNDVYAHRTQFDIYEEILVSEFAKYITTSELGIFTNIDDTHKQAIFSNVLHAIDTILLPILSAQTLNPKEALTSDIVTLSQRLGSALILTEYMGTLDFNDALESRRLSNLKQQLMSEKRLIQDCE